MQVAETICIGYPASAEQLCNRILRNAGDVVSADTIWWLELALTEAINNAVHHGNKKDKNKKAIIDYRWTDDLFSVTVTDEGDGFDVGGVGDPTDAENINKDTGRGVYLIRHVMDEVSYSEKGNSITMVKYLK